MEPLRVLDCTFLCRKVPSFSLFINHKNVHKYDHFLNLANEIKHMSVFCFEEKRHYKKESLITLKNAIFKQPPFFFTERLSPQRLRAKGARAREDMERGRGLHSY